MSERPGWLMQVWAQVPDGRDWLGVEEAEMLSSLRAAPRRRDWLLGRWTGKQALLQSGLVCESGVDLSDLEILPRPSGAPVVCLRGVELPLAISLSHRGGEALCVVSRTGPVGCDLERVEPRSEAFIEDYLAPPERALIEALPEQAALLANACWSARESGLKLLGLGLTVDTRSVEVELDPDRLPTTSWQSFSLLVPATGRRMPGWWRCRNDRILSLVCDTETGPPVSLQRGGRGRVPAS